MSNTTIKRASGRQYKGSGYEQKKIAKPGSSPPRTDGPTALTDTGTGTPMTLFQRAGYEAGIRARSMAQAAEPKTSGPTAATADTAGAQPRINIFSGALPLADFRKAAADSGSFHLPAPDTIIARPAYTLPTYTSYAAANADYAAAKKERDQKKRRFSQDWSWRPNAETLPGYAMAKDELDGLDERMQHALSYMGEHISDLAETTGDIRIDGDPSGYAERLAQKRRERDVYVASGKADPDTLLRTDRQIARWQKAVDAAMGTQTTVNDRGFSHSSGKFDEPEDHGWFGNLLLSMTQMQGGTSIDAPGMPLDLGDAPGETVHRSGIGDWLKNVFTAGAAGYAGDMTSIVATGRSGNTFGKEMVSDALQGYIEYQDMYKHQVALYLAGDERISEEDYLIALDMIDNLQFYIDAYSEANEVEQRSGELTRSVANDLYGIADEGLQSAMEGQTAVGQVLTKASVAGVQQLMDLVVGYGIGGVEGRAIGSMGAMLLRSFGSGASEAAGRGGDATAQITNGLKTAAVEYLTEKLFGGNPTYDADAGLVNQCMQKLGGSEELLDFLSSMPVETLNEGLEEIASDVLNPVVEYIATGEADWPTLEQLIEDGIIGVILGAEGQAVDTVESKAGMSADGGLSGNTNVIIPDVMIGKSVGARAKNYDILDPDSGEYYSFVEGSRIQDCEVFAGYHTHSRLDPDVADGLAEQIGGVSEKWQHCKGYGHVNVNGEDVIAEVHWFQEESVGRHKFKIKRWLFDED